MSNSLQITFLDVGQGDAIVVILPDRKSCIIIDSPKILNSRKIVSDFLINNRLESVELALITHSDSDHSGVADLITEILDNKHENHMHVKRFGFLPDRTKMTPQYRILLNQIKSFKEYNIKGWEPSAANTLVFDNVTISVIYPDMFDRCGAATTEKNCNNSSAIIKIEYGDRKILLGGDLEGEGWASIIKDKKDLSSDIFKVPHHGSLIEDKEGFNYKELIDCINPEFAIISVGTQNTYGHPSEKTLEIIKESNVNTNIICTQVCELCMDKDVELRDYRNDINREICSNSLAYSNEKMCACCGSVSFEIHLNGKIDVNPTLDAMKRIKAKFKNCKCM